jgi:hypothetical protein
VTPAIEIRQEFDSNIGYRENDTESDLVTAVTPSVALSYEGDRGHVRTTLGLRSRSYWDHSELNGIDRFVRVDFERMLTQRLAVFSEGSYEFFPDHDPAFQDDLVLVGDRPDYTRHLLSGGLRYALDPLSTLTFAGGFGGENFDRGDGQTSFTRRDRQNLHASMAYARQLSERDETGLTLRFLNDEFDEVELGSGEETSRTFVGTLHWARAWTPVWSSRVAAGARVARLDEEAIPGLSLPSPSTFDLSPTDTSVGVVGSLEMSRRTARTVTTLGYSRETVPSSGYGSNVDSDTVSASFTAQLSDRLQLELSGYAQRYDSVGESLVVRERFFIVGGFPVVPVFCEPLGLTGFAPGTMNGGPVCVGLTDDEIDATLFGGRAQLGWRVNPHWSTFLRYTFRDQSSRGDRRVAEYTDHRVMMGFRYRLPIDLY